MAKKLLIVMGSATNADILESAWDALAELEVDQEQGRSRT